MANDFDFSRGFNFSNPVHTALLDNSNPGGGGGCGSGCGCVLTVIGLIGMFLKFLELIAWLFGNPS